MQGSRKFILSAKNIIFDIEIKRNVTLIRGDGATYKTLLCNMLRASQIKGSGVHLFSYQTKVLCLTDQEFAADHLRQYKGTDAILVFDESATCIRTNAFRASIEETGCYFILITRNKCSNFGMSTKEIYELKSSDSSDLSKRTVFLQQLYPTETFGKYIYQRRVITEDSGAGKQFFNATFNSQNVVTAHSKDNVAKTIMNNPNSVVVVDGAAFGFNLEDTLPLLVRYNCFLIAKESFEYVILKSGILDHLLSVSIDSPLVESEKYLTWERYYTDLLRSITEGTQLYYDKLNLNSAYLQPTNKNRILAVYNIMPPATGTDYFR